MFADAKSGRSLFITMKRYDGRTKPVPRKQAANPDAHATGENTCLIRATLGKKKLSTVVHQKDMNRFNQAYANVLKANLDGLKKRDKRVAAAPVKASVGTSKATTKSQKSPLIGAAAAAGTGATRSP
ncbi:unnamed protein product [Schistocephalus solidus]|nr:unnamed protein product [Schistocephalus solidus]